MKNRMLPLGYRIEDGAIVVAESEAEIVETIFNEYCSGRSMKTLVNHLNELNAEFKKNATPWNKGRLFHILTDKRYIGERGFPQIIVSDVFEKANSLKSEKCGSSKDLSDVILHMKKIIRCGKCGGKLMRSSDGRWYCANGCALQRRPTDSMLLSAIMTIVDKVYRLPDLLTVTQLNEGYKRTPEIMRMTDEIARINEQIVPSFLAGKALLLRLAASKFTACKEDKSIYTDYVLQQVKRIEANGGVDTEFFHSAVYQFRVTGKDKYELCFCNDAIVSNAESMENAS